MSVTEVVLQYRLLRATEAGDVLVLGFSEERLTDDLAVEIGEEFTAAAAREEFKKILLDFSGVDFACSDVIAKLIILNKRMRQRGGNLTVCGICPYLREILAITRLDTVLDIAGNEPR